MRKLSPAYLETRIAQTVFFTGKEAMLENLPAGCDALTNHPKYGLDRVTFCVMTHVNGAKFVGVNYGAIDADQHRAEEGRARAHAQAMDKVWEAEGFLLREEIHCQDLQLRLTEQVQTVQNVPVAPFNLQPGDAALKYGGNFQATGTVVSTFLTKAGEVRHVFEFDNPAGMLHIYTPGQLKRL